MPATTTKLKIAVFLERFPCLSETFILNQLLYLVKQGHILHIYAEGSDGMPVHPQVISAGLLPLTTYIYKGKGKLARIRQALSAAFSVDISVLLKSLNFFKYGKAALSFRLLLEANAFHDAPAYDVIHVHFGDMANKMVLLKTTGVMQTAPMITSFHGYDINPKYISQYGKEYHDLFNTPGIITANSNFTLDLLRKAGCPENKLAKLPVSLDTAYVKRNKALAKDDNLINIIFCGRLVEFKAPELVPEIADVLINQRGYKNVRFHIIGSGPLKSLVIDGINKYNLQDDILLHGAKTQDEIIDMLSVMDIFLYPGITDEVTGRAENQGLVLQEAQAMELPVVTSDAGGIPEGVIDGKTAFVVPERDIKSFSDKVELLINDKTMREKMGTEGRNFVRQNFDFDILGKQLEEYYYAVLD